MSLAQHLLELRKRLIIAVIALIVAMIVAFTITDLVIYLITAPVRDLAEKYPELAKLNYNRVTSAFDLRLRISFAIGLLVASPVWLWQLWAFILPGLTRKEIRYTAAFVCTAIPLFFSGCAVGFILIPHVVDVLASFTPDDGALFLTAIEYYDLVFKLLIVVGCAFVLPIFLVALNLVGVVSGRTILKGWRVAILVSAIFAGLTTPAADLVSMIVLAGILIVLFFAAAALSLLFDRRRSRRTDAHTE